MCLMSTKHSGWRAAPQAVFHAQKVGPKRTDKTGACSHSAGISKVNTALIHRLVHDTRLPTNGRAALQFWYSAFMLRRITKLPSNRSRFA
jgi:hypothetical protein